MTSNTIENNIDIWIDTYANEADFELKILKETVLFRFKSLIFTGCVNILDTDTNTGESM